MLESAICIVDITMKNRLTIFLNVLELHWHSFNGTIEDAWIINIVPCKEKLVCSLEFLELSLPESACVFIQEVHEG